MTTRELINALRGLYMAVNYAKYTDPNFDFESFSEAAKCLGELEKQLSENQPEWISVEERLPGAYGRYISYNGEDIKIRSFDPVRQGSWILGEVTHWMPLPEPPKPKLPTFKDVFLKAFPKTCNVCFVDFCPKTFFESIKCPLPVVCSEKTIEACWNQPYFEEEGGE